MIIAKQLFATLSICILTTLAPVPADADQDKIEAAIQASAAWLMMVDGGDYAASWEQASTLFRGVVTSDEWVNALNGVRTPLGELMGRSLAASEYATSLPGAPDGEYVVLAFETGFANKRSAVETLTMMLDQDGTWRTAGYFIR